MRININILLFLFICTQFSCMQEKNEMDQLTERIEKELNIEGAEFGVAFKDLKSGNTILINAKKSFHAASTMKTPVLVEIYRQASLGKFSMTDSINISNNFKSIVDGSPFSLSKADDSELELYNRLGEKESIYSLAHAMIIRSSNLATNILIELVTADSVMKTMKSIGANDIKVLRGVEDNKAFHAGMNNTTTAYDLMLLFELLAQEKLVNDSSSREMINILLDQEFGEIIPAKLPDGVKVAHKTGSITGIHHDSGFVILPDGRRYVLVLLSKFNQADEKKVIAAMAEVSRMIYDEVAATAG